MVLFLILNVLSDQFQIGLRNREGGIATLPIEFRVSCPLSLHPFGARFFDLFDNFGKRMVFRKQKQRVDMIVDTANDQRSAFQTLERPRLIGIETPAYVRGNPRGSVSRAVYKMHEVFDQ